MIAGDDLRRWAEDPAEQRAAAAASAKFDAGWRDGPVHQHFLALMAGVRVKTPASLTRAFLELFANDDWVDVLVDALACRMRDDPYFVPTFQALRSDVHSGLLVFEDEHVSIAAGVSQAAQLAAKKHGKTGGSINFTGQVHVLKFTKAGGATLSFWEIPPITDTFSAGTAGLCRPAGTRRLEDGATLVIDGRSQSYAIDHAETNILLLQAVIKTDQRSVGAEYDAATGALLGCTATDDAASRIQMIATLVRKLGHDDAFPAVAAFLDHPAFFVRWHVMRELIGLDAGRALPLLRDLAATDPHPDVQAAAVSTLAALDHAARERLAAA